MVLAEKLILCYMINNHRLTALPDFMTYGGFNL